MRLAAAESLAHAGWHSSSAQTAVARRFLKEKEPTIREALLYAMYRIGVVSKLVQKARDQAEKDSDPSVRAMAHYGDMISSSLPPWEHHAGVADAVAAHARLERLGKIGADAVPGRIAVVRWRLLDECDLPCFVGLRVGERLPILPLQQLGQDAALAAVEKALEAPADAPAEEVLPLYDAAVAAVENGKAASVERARLAAALHIHFARTRSSPSAATSGDAIERLDRHLETLKKVATGLGPHELVAVRVLEGAVGRAIEAVRPAGDELSRVEVLQAVIDEHESRAQWLGPFPEQVQWMDLGRAELLDRLAERTGKKAERKRAWELAYDVVGSAIDSFEGRRVALRAAALATRLAPDVNMSRLRTDLLRRAPESALFGGTAKDGLRVELVDVASQEVPLRVQGQVGVTSGREVLVVRVRVTLGGKAGWDAKAWQPFVRARRGVPKKPVDVPRYEPEVQGARVILDVLGHQGIPGNWEPDYWERKSTLCAFLFDTSRPQLSDDLVIDLGVKREGASEPEIVAS
ncbi:MAG: hypothetical protein R3F05_16675, partial [Planctomycetota bacterium]